jgi:putative peptidoglycan lipid II flippase
MHEIARENIVSAQTNEMSDKKSITIGALIQVAFTLLSRVFGMIRDVMVSHIFGAGALTDAFIVAFTIPNVLRQFFGEGAFSVAFVPIYISTKENSGQEKAREFFKDAFGFLLLSLVLLTILGIFFSGALVHLFASGFADKSEQFAIANRMTKYLFPYVFMVSLVALFGAYLACYKRFAAMSAAPVLLNITMIVVTLLWIDYFSPPIMVLTAGVFLGGILQVLLMIAALKRAKIWALPRFSLKSEAMQKLLKLLGPALFGIFVYQLNIIVLRQLASFLGEGQISYYYNADRLAQFATGVFAVSIATAALPELSKGKVKYGNLAFFETLRFTLTLTSFIITPCACGLLVFAYPVIAVLFVHGAFSNQDAIVTAHTLVAFSPSLIAFGLSRPLIQAFYAESDTKTPVFVGIITVILNFILGLILIRFEVVGLAATLSLSSTIQFFILLFLFKKKTLGQFSAQLIKPFFMHVGLSMLACAMGLILSHFGAWHEGFTVKNALVLAMFSGLAALSYFFFAYIFKVNEARKFIDGLRLRLWR